VNFPIELTAHIASNTGDFTSQITLNRGLTVLLGPNGSGKTHLLRGLKNSFGQHMNGKHVRFLSAGRMGLLEHTGQTITVTSEVLRDTMTLHMAAKVMQSVGIKWKP
jgi:recombinational DNA repair ATPase RecF